MFSNLQSVRQLGLITFRLKERTSAMRGQAVSIRLWYLKGLQSIAPKTIPKEGLVTIFLV